MTLVTRLLVFMLITLSSCGYYRGQGGVVDAYTTISIPYVGCDTYGNLTADLVREIDKSGVLRYSPGSGQLQLNIKVVEIRDENIGFRYDRDKEGKETKSVIPTETRRKMVVEVSVQERFSCSVILGPARLTSFVDFDHDYFSSTDGINVSSLGQLTDIEAAEDAVLKPLNCKMAKKIVDYICGSW